MIVKPQLAKLGLFDAKVPRYTSYPTAPHFSNDVGPDRFGDWISDIKPGSAVSLYIHVPFCRRLCWFCACRTQGTQTDNPVIAYVDVLKAELDLLAQRLPSGVTLSRLHWGGGTPTLLNPGLMRDLASYILGIVPMGPDAEFSVEIDPNEVDEARLDALAEAGMNRASIGVQDFDDEIQKTIGRIQSYDTTREAIEMIRARGISSLNADILYGLPHQTKTRMTESVQKLLSLNPDRVALYGYAHVPWMAKRQRMLPEEALPDADARWEQAETAARLLVEAGYQRVGLDHFALPGDEMAVAAREGRLQRNFQGYTTDDAGSLIGLGATAISSLPGGYCQNIAETGAWSRAVEEGRLPVARGVTLTADDRLRRDVISDLMCHMRVDLGTIADRHGVPLSVFDSDLARCDAFARDGLLHRDGPVLHVAEQARPVLRVVAAAFDSYLDRQSDGPRHAVAV